MLIKMMFWISWREWEDDGLIPCRNRISKYKMVKEKDGGRDQSLQLLLTKSLFLRGIQGKKGSDPGTDHRTWQSDHGLARFFL